MDYYCGWHNGKIDYKPTSVLIEFEIPMCNPKSAITGSGRLNICNECLDGIKNDKKLNVVPIIKDFNVGIESEEVNENKKHNKTY